MKYILHECPSGAEVDDLPTFEPYDTDIPRWYIGAAYDLYICVRYCPHCGMKLEAPCRE